jgi:hypothetical protein
MNKYQRLAVLVEKGIPMEQALIELGIVSSDGQYIREDVSGTDIEKTSKDCVTSDKLER